MVPIDNIIALAKDLFWVKAPGKGKYPYCNGFLITGSQNLLIDAGIGEEMIKDANQAFDDYLAIFEQRKQQILDLFDGPKSFADLVAASPFYRNKMPDKNLQFVFEGRMIQKNLDLLSAEGRIKSEGGVYDRTDGI